MKILKRSEHSGKINEMEINVDPDKLQQWQKFDYRARPFIQDFFPELNADEREFLLSGMTPQEWKDFCKDD